MTNQKNRHVSPDGKWQVVVIDGEATWIELTEPKYQYTIQELVEATKNIKPEIW